MFLNNKGRTIVEMITVVIILGIISAVAYPMIFMNERILNRQIKESATRNDIRGLENFLKEDLRNCQNFEFIEGDEPDLYTYKVNLCTEKVVEYKKIINDKGQSEIIREYESEKFYFPDIREIKLEKNGNSRLFNAKIWTCESKNDEEPCHELKIERWEWLMKKEESTDGVVEFMAGNNVAVMATNFGVHASLGLDGKGITLFIPEKEKYEHDSDHLKGFSNIYIKGSEEESTKLKGGKEIGNRSDKGDLIFGSSVEVSTGSKLCTPGFGIHGDVYIAGDLILNGGSICDNLYVQGNLYLIGGTLNTDGVALRGANIYVNGNLEISGGNHIIKSDIYVNGDVNIDGATITHDGGLIPYRGTIRYYRTNNGTTTRDYLKKADTPKLVPTKEIPKLDYPVPQDPSWYAARGYSSSTAFETGQKYYYISNGDFSHNSAAKSYDNMVVVVEDGDIYINPSAMSVSGVFFAPKGKVTLYDCYKSEGLIIARDGVITSGNVIPKTLQELTGPGKLFPSEDDYPFKNPE